MTAEPCDFAKKRRLNSHGRPGGRPLLSVSTSLLRQHIPPSDARKLASRRNVFQKSALLCFALLVGSALTGLIPSARAAFGVFGGSGSCLKNADQHMINKLFSDGGPGTKIQLCPSITYTITGPITFTNKDQELSTEGYPTKDDLKAKIVLDAGNDVATAIQGDCRRCARVAIRNLVINGNREKHGRINDGEGAALILLGNNEGQRISHCNVYDPRGWAAIQLREGDNLNCKEAIIEDNRIGPAGEEYIPSVDGDEPELSPIGRPLADGLSLACRDSVVRRNHFVDTTSAAIVIFCAPGSIIESNHVRSIKMSQMGGILMIDSTPFDGDYTSTVVRNNTIEADEDAFMRIGIGIGAAVWSDDTDSIIRGGRVENNYLGGGGMGYGIAASNVRDFAVVDNESTARFSGFRGTRCLVPVEPDEPGYERLTPEEKENGVIRNPLPMGFVRHAKTVHGGQWQEDFVDEDFTYLVCIDPDPATERVVVPPSDEPHVFVAPADAELGKKPVRTQRNDDADGPISVVDEILDHSQARLLDAMKKLGERVDEFITKAALERKLSGGTISNRGLSMEEDGVKILASLSHISNRVAALETERNSMRGMIDDFKKEMDLFGKSVRETEAEEMATLRELQSLLRAAAKSREQRMRPKFSAQDALRRSQGLVQSSKSWFKIFAWTFACQVSCGMLALAWQRWHKRRKDVKVI